MIGAEFSHHPLPSTQRLVVEDRSNTIIRALPASFAIHDESYVFKHDPRTRSHILLRLDTPHDRPDRPLVWCRRGGRGRFVLRRPRSLSSNMEQPLPSSAHPGWNRPGCRSGQRPRLLSGRPRPRTIRPRTRARRIRTPGAGGVDAPAESTRREAVPRAARDRCRTQSSANLCRSEAETGDRRTSVCSVVPATWAKPPCCCRRRPALRRAMPVFADWMQWRSPALARGVVDVC